MRISVAVHRADPALHRVLERITPRFGEDETLGATERELLRYVASWLARYREQLVVDDLERAAFVVVSTVEALTHGTLLTDPARLADERIVDEACRLVLGYLTGGT